MAVKNPQTAFLVSVFCGVFGFLGVGHIYAGYAGQGFAIMLGYWLVSLFLAFLTMSAGFFLGPLAPPLSLLALLLTWLFTVTFSSKHAYRLVEDDNRRMGYNRGEAGGGRPLQKADVIPKGKKIWR